MAKAQRRDQLNQDLLEHLQAQVRFMYRSSDSFDQGDEDEATRLAAALRILLHVHGQSVGLLTQLGLKRMPFLDSARPINLRNLLSECTLTIQEVGIDMARWRPQLVQSDLRRPVGRPFDDWWNRPVIRLPAAGEVFSRKDLVLFQADQDGGAHVDPSLDERHYRLSRSNALGWEFRVGDQPGRPMNSPVLACIRQIAHEVLGTLQRQVPAAIPPERLLPRSERRRF